MADWSEMMPELLAGIAEQVTSYHDQLNFAGVCNSWRSAAATVEYFSISPIRRPFLFLPDPPAAEHAALRQLLILVSSLSISRLPPPSDSGDDYAENAAVRKLFILPSSLSSLKLPEVRNRYCASSSRGWLITIGDDNTDVNLLHPLTRQQISLPKLDTFPYYNTRSYGTQNYKIVRKMVLSCDPSSTDEDCFVMIIWGFPTTLGFCRLGDDSWTDVWDSMHMRIIDIAYHNRLLFVVTRYHKIMVFDVHSPNPEISQYINLPLTHRHRNLSRVYVLGGSDDNKLLIVVANVAYYFKFYLTHSAGPFEVFELNLMRKSWSKVDNLGSKAILLGHNSSMLVDADDSAVEANCIYFRNDIGVITMQKRKNLNIYRLSNGSIKPYFSYMDVHPPIWVEPSLDVV